MDPWGALGGTFGGAASEDPSGDPRGDPRTIGGIRGRTLGEPWGDPWGHPWKTSGGILGDPCGNSNGLGAWRLKFHSLGRDFQLPRRVASGMARWGAVVGKPTCLLLTFRGNGVRASFADVRGRRGPRFFTDPQGSVVRGIHVLLYCVCGVRVCVCVSLRRRAQFAQTVPTAAPSVPTHADPRNYAPRRLVG